MKSKNSLRRGIVALLTLALLVGGIFLINHDFSRSKSGGESSAKDNSSKPIANDDSELATKRSERRERAEKLMEYSNEGNGEKLKLVLDKIVLRGEDGTDEVVPLSPIATPETLGERLAAFSAPRGVFPLAYVEGEEGSFDGLRLITSELRVQIPREEAKALANEHGLTILDFPEYAPEWVVFDSNGPMDALEKIGAVRSEDKVASADVLIGRRPSLMASPNDSLYPNQWHLKRSGAALPGTDINVENAWKFGETGGVLGTGINIGIIDSGIQTSHPDFVGNIDITIDEDFITRDGDPNPERDENHGTAVGGVAGARGNNGLGVSGVAPRATLVGLRLITGTDFISDRQIGDAFNHRNDVIQVKNNSWGYTASIYKLEPLQAAALLTSSTTGRNGKGTVFAFSAGNSALSGDNANFSELKSSIYTIVVGATSSLGKRSSYSEPGSNVVITAPSGKGGTDPSNTLGISTADRTGTAGYNNSAGAAGDYTNTFNGTSSSCPVISGVIALMLEKNPELGWRDVQEVLIRSAVKFNPNEAGWTTNAAGLHFNNEYGAGLVDATAAVELAGTWTNLAPQASVASTRSGLNASIPNNNSAGRSIEFLLPNSNIIAEHVTLKLDVSHSARGELEVYLISPSGTSSQLASRRNDVDFRGNPYANFENYTFNTVHNWSETSAGVWTLRVVDRSSANNTTGGTINSAVLTVYGVDAPPTNPAPIVQITSPADDSVFSPNATYTVRVTATDFDIDENPDTIEKVELYENDVLVGTLTEAPYNFTRTPADGVYTYVAKATDPDDAVGSSLPIEVTVKNQTPVINSVVVPPLGPVGLAYDDQVLVVSSVDAIDPEDDPITLAYQWQFSTDELTYVGTGSTTNTLAANSSNSSKLWRCAITASDGNTTSEPFYTDPINLLDRPVNLAGLANSYSYQSGLVLRGDELEINRQAIIHEFSQGSGGGTAEWIEILTLKAGSLAGWRLTDEAGNRLQMKSTAVWDSIPAGTLIVIYNGNTAKDSVLPADSTNAASWKMVISSNNTTYFEEGSPWPTLGNQGDAIFLADQDGTGVHEVSYGLSLGANPNVGEVISGAAAYYVGETDSGADLSGEWLVTTSSASRTTGLAIEPLSVFPGVTLTNGRYDQDFNDEPGANGNFFPTGWSSYSVDLANTQTSNYDFLEIFGGVTSPGGPFNFGSRIGIYAGSEIFDPGFIALGIEDSRNVTGLKISYDIQKIVDLTRSMDIELQFTVGPPANTSTVWTPVSGTQHRTGSNPAGTITKFQNVPLSAIFNDRDTPIYLRWYYQTSQNNGGTGGRDGFAIDNVIISSNQSPNIVLGLALNPNTVLETAGANASIGTVSLSQALATPLTVNILSSDISEATVPPSIVIPAGQLSATFPIRAIDDNISDGPQSVFITVGATDFVDVSKNLTVTDNEPSAIGVTPGLPNNTANSAFIMRLRTNRIIDPPIFRLATGSVLPTGLTLDPLSGLISGIINANAAPGSYPITIELNNILGGFTSQTIVINLTATGTFTYGSWIALFTVSDATTGGDPDFDQLPNLVEYALNSLPGSFEQPSPVIFEQSPTEISMTYSIAKAHDDVEVVAQWSNSMTDGTWTDIVSDLQSENSETMTMKATLTITPGEPKRFMRLKATEISPS